MKTQTCIPTITIPELADNVTHMDCSQCGDKLQKDRRKLTVKSAGVIITHSIESGVGNDNT